MLNAQIHLALLAFSTPSRPPEPLEIRMKRFLESDAASESLDDEKFAKINGSSVKADYFLGHRRFIAELKTINGDPKPAIEQRLKARFAKKDAPFIYGKMGVAPILAGMPDGDDLSKMMNGVSARAVRRHLQRANEQIVATKTRFNLAKASGVTIIMNDSEPMVDASGIAYAIKGVLEAVESRCPHIDYVWARVECHRIRMLDGSLGYPQLVVFKGDRKVEALDFIASMVMAWASFNRSALTRLDHGGGWDSMRPIFDEGPPMLSLF